MNDSLEITSAGLTLEDVVDVARGERKVTISADLLAKFDGPDRVGLQIE